MMYINRKAGSRFLLKFFLKKLNKIQIAEEHILPVSHQKQPWSTSQTQTPSVE